MCPVMIQFGSLRITGYWFMAVVGMSVSILYIIMSNRSGRVKKMEWCHIFNLCCIAVFSIYIGSILMGALVNLVGVVQKWSYYQNHIQELFHVLTASRAFYGGAILSLVLFTAYVHRYHISVDTLCSLFVPAAALFMVFGRLGCFMGGCCYGTPVDWGIVFPPQSLAPSGIPLFPSQLIEAGCHLIFFVILIILERRVSKKWLLLSFYVVSYAIVRFILEFWRGDMIRGVWILSSSQWVSIAMLVGVCIHFAIWKYKRKQVV